MKEWVRWWYLARAPRLGTNILRGRHDFTYDLMPFRVRGMSWARRLNLLRAGAEEEGRRPARAGPSHALSGHQGQREDFICQEVSGLSTVLVDGTVVGCDQDFNAQAAYGRIGEGISFRDVWFGPTGRAVRRRVRRTPRTVALCRNCPYPGRTENTCSIRYVDLRGRAPAAR